MMRKYLFTILSLFLLTVSCSKDSADNDGPRTPKKGNVPESVDPEHFTILSWTGVNNPFADFGFAKLLECGCNTYLGWYSNLGDAVYALERADLIGIKMIISCPELHTDTRRTVAEFTSHKSFFAYHIDDEPEVSEFANLEGQINNIAQYDTEHTCYVNLYPNWCWGEDAYIGKLRSFVKKVPVRFISFDNYPCKMVGGELTVRPDWYHNLEDIRTVAKDNGLPFWAFALSLSHSTNEAFYPIPSIGELRLQQFSNLVYGATGFQYFTTWGHIQDNYCTGVFKDIQRINAELSGLEPIFHGADIKYVWHIGSEIPSGCKEMTKAPGGISRIDVGDGNAVISYFVNNDTQYVAIVNANPSSGMDLDIVFDDNVKALRYDKDSNSAEFKPGPVRLAAGDIAIYSWQ